MKRASGAAIGFALLLAGCPLPQPLPTYPAGTITPPRILAAKTTAGVQSILPVPASCATAPAYALDATIFYQESVTVEARWFVDYKSDDSNRNGIRNTIREVPPDPNPAVLERQVPTLPFKPYDFPPPSETGIPALGPPYNQQNIVHVIELVVSNGFATPPADAAQPNRTPGTTPDGASQFEIQTYRWVFVNVPEDPTATCTPGDVGCPRCPP